MRRVMRSVLGSVLLVAVTSSVGCIIDIPLEEPEQGYTECGDFLAPHGDMNMCQPGQYCEDPTFSDCVEGCLSNVNCAEDQRCVKADGTNIGTCQAEIKRPASNPR